jgi:hypothetical protein
MIPAPAKGVNATAKTTVDVEMGPPPPPPLVDDQVDNALMAGILLPPLPPLQPAIAAAITRASASISLSPVIMSAILHASTSTSTSTSTPIASGAVVAFVAPEETFGVRNMTAPLREEILEMSEGEREVYMRRLKRMSDFDLQRENNIARNRAWMRELGLTNASAFFGMKKK